MAASVATMEMGPQATPHPAERPPQRLRQEALADGERSWAIFMHLSPLSIWMLGLGPLLFLPPLILWLARRDASVFNDDHGRETLNFSISFIILHVLLALTIVGVILMPVLWIVGVVNVIRGAVAAGNGEYFRYPVTIRLLK